MKSLAVIVLVALTVLTAPLAAEAQQTTKAS